MKCISIAVGKVVEKLNLDLENGCSTCFLFIVLISIVKLLYILLAILSVFSVT